MAPGTVSPYTFLTMTTSHRIYKTSFASVYPLYVQKAAKKGRTQAEVDELILWLTGYTPAGLKKQIQTAVDFETFFARAPKINPKVSEITGVVCGVRVEDIADPLMRNIRYLDKLIDELAKGKKMEAVLRSEKLKSKSMAKPAASPAVKSDAGPNPDVDRFLQKAKIWRAETEKLRAVLLKTGLEENFKWRLPCYSHNGRNIVIIQPFKACLGLMFFKGALLKDPKNALVANGPNSQSSRRMEFRSVKDVTKLAPTISAYIKEAIAAEESGLKVKTEKKPVAVPAELKKAFAKNAAFKKAFAALTPGRQRAYLFHIGGAKQPATREARIKKLMPRILQGKGLLD